MEAVQELQNFVILQPGFTEGATLEIKWNDNNTRMLIDLYAKYKPKVGTMKIRTIKQMWQIIAGELQQVFGVIVTPNNCENRWKVLDRNYKKYVDNQNSTGRGKKHFEYYEDMQVIFGRKKNVSPELLLTSQSVHVPEDTEHNKENQFENVIDMDTATRSEQGSSSKLKVNVMRKAINENQVRNNIRKRKSTLMEHIRSDRQNYMEKRLQIEQEKLEQLKIRNQLIKDRNDIMKENHCKCVCKCSQLQN